ncbi:hypothetical protein HanXRQr2_Chr10g0445381 [Helianthus annuus]|uniref:Uncharacterized protein n=1 Tax=Helianthus annuus TaxID=4232 RepID=A0A9K3HYH3_HELAN|nr:hypothetical protein HanXRQr2_Chr10g0445381 [Helianthus annuus]
MPFPTYPHEYHNPKASSDIISDETVSTWSILIHPCSNRKIWTVENVCEFHPLFYLSYILYIAYTLVVFC